jgi:S-formylglutathione hydrolase FrmB
MKHIEAMYNMDVNELEEVMSDKQKQAVACALADLIGSLQAFEQDDIHVHDWQAHQQSIDDLLEAFDFLNLDKGQ